MPSLVYPLAALAIALAGAACAGDAPTPEPKRAPDRVASAAPVVTITAPEVVTSHPESAAGSCSSGCSLAKHPIPEISRDELVAALHAFANEPLGAESDALDTLVFYWWEAGPLLADPSAEVLSDDHRAFLEAELTRTHATIDIRLVELDGTERVRTGPRVVPLGEKQHLHPRLVDVQELTLNGTVMRTAAHHLWARF